MQFQTLNGVRDIENAKVPAVAPATIEPHLMMTRPIVKQDLGHSQQFCITYEGLTLK
jgi:hypothetical protein